MNRTKLYHVSAKQYSIFSFPTECFSWYIQTSMRHTPQSKPSSVSMEFPTASFQTFLFP